jgi:hypothetical protein
MNTQQIINGNSQFYADLIDENKAINVNGSMMPKGYYNLIITIRDLGLYEIGLKPNRHWKISQVKAYFGIKGTATQMRAELKAIKEAITQG